MTDKQPDALVQMLQPGGIVPIDIETTAALVAEITRQHEAIERKDALLRQALEAMTHGCPPGCNDGMTDSGGTYPWGEAVLIPCPTCETVKAITKELEQ